MTEEVSSVGVSFSRMPDLLNADDCVQPVEGESVRSNAVSVGASPCRRGRASSPSPVAEQTKSSSPLVDRRDQISRGSSDVSDVMEQQDSAVPSTTQMCQSDRLVGSSPRKRNRASSPAPVVQNKTVIQNFAVGKAKQFHLSDDMVSQNVLRLLLTGFIFLTFYASTLLQSTRANSVVVPSEAIDVVIEDNTTDVETPKSTIEETLKLLKSAKQSTLAPELAEVPAAEEAPTVEETPKVEEVQETPKVEVHEALPAKPHTIVSKVAEEYSCGGLDDDRNVQCKEHVAWAFQNGRFESWAPTAYSGVLEIAGVTFLEASLEDFQRFFFCGMPEMACGLPPCSCSISPCDVCSSIAPNVEPEMGHQTDSPEIGQIELETVHNVGLKAEVQDQIKPETELRIPVESNPPVVQKEEVEPGPQPLQAIGYSPVPFKHAQWLKSEDFMNEQVRDFWGSHSTGRGDLAIIGQMGATSVRVREVDPSIQHKAFLDETKKQGMTTIVGLSDYPYVRMPGNCVETQYNCYAQVFSEYSAMLRTGFTDQDSYHPALDTVIVAEELDSKFSNAIDNPKEFCLAVITAIDAILQVEKLFGITKNLPLLSASFGFQTCRGCGQYSKVPALGQMAQLRASFLNPLSVGYSPQNDMRQAYTDRFVNSFTAVDGSALEIKAFQSVYDKHFAGTRVFISDLHLARTASKDELDTILDLARNPQSMLRGFSFSEFQMRHDRAETSQRSALFALGSEQLGKVQFFGQKVSSWCLSARDGLPGVVAAAFGGSVATLNGFCSS